MTRGVFVLLCAFAVAFALDVTEWDSFNEDEEGIVPTQTESELGDFN